MKPTFFLFIFCVVLSYTNKNEIEGDLYFKLVDFGFSNLSPKQIQFYDLHIDKIRTNPESTVEERQLLKLYEELKRDNLLAEPAIRIKSSNDEIFQIYLSRSEFDKVKQYTLQDLRSRNKKLRVKLKYEKVKDRYFSKEIVEMREIDGETPWNK